MLLKELYISINNECTGIIHVISWRPQNCTQALKKLEFGWKKTEYCLAKNGTKCHLNSSDKPLYF